MSKNVVYSATVPIKKTAAHWNTLQLCVVPERRRHSGNTLQHTGTHWNTLQHTATHCNTLQHTATHCNTLQHTATHCITLQHTASKTLSFAIYSWVKMSCMYRVHTDASTCVRICKLGLVLCICIYTSKFAPRKHLNSGDFRGFYITLTYNIPTFNSYNKEEWPFDYIDIKQPNVYICQRVGGALKLHWHTIFFTNFNVVNAEELIAHKQPLR